MKKIYLGWYGKKVWIMWIKRFQNYSHKMIPFMLKRMAYYFLGCGGMWRGERERGREGRVKVGIYISFLLLFSIFFCLTLFKPIVVIKSLSSLNIFSTHLSETKEETLHLAIELRRNSGHTALSNCISLIQYLCPPYNESYTLNLTFYGLSVSSDYLS